MAQRVARGNVLRPAKSLFQEHLMPRNSSPRKEATACAKTFPGSSQSFLTNPTSQILARRDPPPCYHLVSHHLSLAHSHCLVASSNDFVSSWPVRKLLEGRDQARKVTHGRYCHIERRSSPLREQSVPASRPLGNLQGVSPPSPYSDLKGEGEGPSLGNGQSKGRVFPVTCQVGTMKGLSHTLQLPPGHLVREMALLTCFLHGMGNKVGKAGAHGPV